MRPPRTLPCGAGPAGGRQFFGFSLFSAFGDGDVDAPPLGTPGIWPCCWFRFWSLMPDGYCWVIFQSPSILLRDSRSSVAGWLIAPLLVFSDMSIMSTAVANLPLTLPTKTWLVLEDSATCASAWKALATVGTVFFL